MRFFEYDPIDISEMDQKGWFFNSFKNGSEKWFFNIFHDWIKSWFEKNEFQMIQKWISKNRIFKYDQKIIFEWIKNDLNSILNS